LADPCAVIVRAGEGTLVLTRAGDRILAFRNRCPHAGYPLQRSDGRILVQEDRYMVCGGHGASFTFDGQCAGGPCNGDALERVAIVVRDGIISLA
jgi:nitrite reductase/ring-hydroxylating ferredoxin subunit